MEYGKLSGALLAAHSDLERTGADSLVSYSATLGMPEVMGTQKPPRAIVFIHCADNADLEGYKGELRARINQKVGRIRTALIPLDMLAELSEAKQIQRIHGSRKLRPRMKAAAKKVKIPRFRNETGLSGSNVIVGVIDTGIDPKHPAFKDRILKIWDQTLDGPGVDEGGYGLELSGSIITASRDDDGHGTHVAGIAAGASDDFTGVAPEADLVIVKSSFQDAHVADGIRYIFRIAEDLGRPAVINLSLGGHYDAHDGTDSLSQIIDDEAGPGRIICVSAGNEGADRIHSRIELGAPATRTAKFTVPAGQPEAMLNGWYPGTRKLEILIKSPEGRATRFQKVVSDGNFERRYNVGSARVIVQTPGKDASNGDNSFYVVIRPKPGVSEVPTGTWELKVKNRSHVDGNLDVWTLDDQATPEVVFNRSSADDSCKIGSPACASRAITVGAFVTLTSWKNIDGDEYEFDLEKNEMAVFSCQGPLRDDQEKPDVAAPGALIISCLSADSAPDREYVIDRHHFAEMGTSMAAPFIAGLVALLLEREPDLTPEQVKEMLKAASRIPGKPEGTFDETWGFGLPSAGRL
ncbi:MAG: S8 family peptidase [Planctomycetota bacterium]